MSDAVATPTVISRTPAQLRGAISAVHLPLHVIRDAAGVGMAHAPVGEVLATLPATPAERLGSADFAPDYHARLAYMGGAMAGGIASADLVRALVRAGCLGSYGAAGLSRGVVDADLTALARELPVGSFAVNLIHSPQEPAMEDHVVDTCLRLGIRVIEASAFMDLTPAVVRYRAAGIVLGEDGEVIARNRVIAKVSRAETAGKFLLPAPSAIVDRLVLERTITPEQAALLARVPLADDVTVEGDSGGHTDRRPLAPTFASIAARRARICADFPAAQRVRIGAAGGLGTPESIAAAFTMGADYVVLGSVHQSCVESGTSSVVRSMLVEATTTDVIMAPAADMFELGVELQVLRRGTMFAMRGRKLYETYRAYESVDEIPPVVRAEIEHKILRRSIDDVWTSVQAYFADRDPDQLERAGANGKRKMALIFRWYLGMASRWATTGDPERVSDYQIWAGPALGAFNEWAQGSVFARPEARQVATVAHVLMHAAAYATRVQQLSVAGVALPLDLRTLPASDALVQVTT